VRPGKEGEEGEKKKSGEGGVSGRLCGAPTLTVAATQPMMAVVVDELRWHGPCLYYIIIPLWSFPYSITRPHR
jgi:hypothetical protein